MDVLVRQLLCTPLPSWVCPTACLVHGPFHVTLFALLLWLLNIIKTRL